MDGKACIPQIGSVAPDFTANSTFGVIKLSDYKGKWVVLFSHPADFTPVCTTEFLAFAKCYPMFQQRCVQLIGVSIDSIHSHLAWVYNIYRITGVEIPFPIIADIDMSVASLYGMISPASSSTATVRSVFIIDPNQVVRAVIYYPSTTGRWIPEILRVIDSLQTVDVYKVVTPANWLPGMPVIEPPPQTYPQLVDRIQNQNQQGLKCADWYLCFKPDPACQQLQAEAGKEEENKK